MDNNCWMDQKDQSRANTYETYEDIFMGKHTAAFSRFSAEMTKKKKVLLYVVCNFGGLISKVSADLLFGEQIGISYPDTATDKHKNFIDNFIKTNDLHTQNYESALANSYLGDQFIKLRRDDKGVVYADYINPELVSIETEGDNKRAVESITVGWIKNDNGKLYLRKEIHKKGKIFNELWLLDKSGKPTMKVDMKAVDDYAQIPDSQDTGVDDFLIRHIPNWRTSSRNWGISDYIDLLSLFDEANNRVSRVKDILDKHSDPKLAVPPGVIQPDGTVKGANFDLVEVAGTSQSSLTKPEYITWDASLDAAFKEIDKIVDFLFLFSETSPAAFGMDKNGTADSGRALKFRLIRTMAKISRKKNYYDSALTWLFETAQKLGNVADPITPNIVWQDGIPQDTYEAAQIEEIRLRSGNTSVESSIKRLDGGSEKDIEAEVKKIDDEKKALTANLGNGTPNVTL